MSIPSKRQRTTQSGLYRSISQPAITVSGLSPHVSVHWPTGQPWTDADQADWEAGLARLTASAGLPLRWVENPEWLKLCDRFIPRAKIPSAKVLTKRVMPHVLRGLKVTAKEECRGGAATLQCDGWTGENHHHLLGFMMTVRRKLHAIRVRDASSDARNAEELLKQIIESMNIIESEWGATVIACTTDASGESRKARRLLRIKFPHLVTPDCLAHQVSHQRKCTSMRE
ncbi:hypothetical protein M405DRAFT_737503 [Rhizopogon salebrosus TDB-379]|nr:hypothetical protein M405DRAFT_737503 [Rhizopogon salebrosus TDB-379]